MEQIEQLKAMRDGAKARIEALPDYKLMTSLTTLIGELEQVFGTAPQAASDESSAEEGSEAESEPERGPIEATAAYVATASDEVAVEPEPEAERITSIDDVMSQLGIDTSSPAAETQDELADAVAAELAAEEPVLEEVATNVELAEEVTVEAEEEMDFSELLAQEVGAGETQEEPVDEDEAIRRAMAELEADLDNTRFTGEQSGRRR